MERGLSGLNPVASLESTSMSTPVIAPQSATIVPEASRPEFLPTLFGRSLLIVAENAVYSLMERLSPLDYGGGCWTFYEHEGKPLFLAPQSKSRFRITGEITGFQGEVSAEAAGIIATLFAFSHLSFQYQSEHLSEGYGRLYAYSADHPEAVEIFQAID
ncbi:antirestriction protein [Sinorhizobium meliloti]|nr:antirestriction protein [Sinorhizobium meliloti]MDW9831867.1 antirestriction protein [Sinorhizobium meliloti]